MQEDITLFPLEDACVCFLQQIQDLWPVRWRLFFVYFCYIPERFVRKSRQIALQLPKYKVGSVVEVCVRGM